ncbi:restriction endonuclease subunit S [Streptomyces tauricus]|uniref:restriction endonuclease subunit S n=1 Tax=Streptomyces tauricus TaxID=68274 RepID=UPI0016798B8F|nr:restriction endonuclease subunit S [Streptomyces tauricus]
MSQTKGVVRRSELTDAPQRAESLDAYKVCRKGDIVFNKMKIRSGAMGVAHEDGLVTYHYEVMRPRQGMDPRYIVHLMKSSWFTSELIARERGISAGGEHGGIRTTEVPFTVLRTIDVLLPEIDEQRAIAGYLDRETSRIDTLIEEQQRLIEMLRERRAAVIASTLAKLSDAMTRLKYVSTIQTGVTLSGAGDSADAEWPYLRVANVQVGYVDLGMIKTVRIPSERAVRSMLQRGDVLMTEGGDIDKLGRGALWHGDLPNMLHQNHIFAVRPNESLDSEFLVYWLDGPVARAYFRTTAKQTTNLAATNKWTVGNLPIALPPIEDQRGAVAALDEQTAAIGSLIAETERFIELARERRAALITAAVTGQIDVREAA